MSTTPQTSDALQQEPMTDAEMARARAKRLGLQVDESAGCLERGAKYGVQASLMVAGFGGVDPYSQAAAWAIGGIYGCSRKGGFKKVGRELRRNWRKAAKGVVKATDWVGDLVTGRLFGGKRKGKRQTPPTMDEAIVITWRFFQKEGGHERVLDVGHRWLSTQILADLYGPDAAAWDYKRVVELWWSLWQRSLHLAPSWQPDYRMLHVIMRAGGFLEHAGPEAQIQDWPVLVPESSQPVFTQEVQEESVPVVVDAGHNDEGLLASLFGWMGE